MTRRHAALCAIWGTFALLALACHAVSAEWRPLFDGKSLDGWVRKNGTATYSVEDGAIVGTTVPGSPNSFLCTERDYANFILELEFKVDPALNSGVQIRSLSLPDMNKGRVHGYQVEIDPSARAWTGGIYDEARRGWLYDLKDKPEAREAFRQAEWNHVRVEAVGSRIRTWINGVPAADLQDEMTPAGFIALQVHSTKSKTPLQVRFRNIRIHELDEAAGTTGDVLGPVQDTMGAQPPQDAVVLLGADGDTSLWQLASKPDAPFPWPVRNGVMTVEPGTGSIETRREVTDFMLHLEFNVNARDRHSQDNGNSGVYVQRRYEIQILNSYGQSPGDNECGAVYKIKAPDRNASRPAGEWQTYDIVFRSPRWDKDGKKTENARVSVAHNGVLIHNNVAIPDKTGSGRKESPEPGPILLQDHGNPVAFRNVWTRDLHTLVLAASPLDEALEQLRNFESGQSRRPLREIESAAATENQEQKAALAAALETIAADKTATLESRAFACRLLNRIGGRQTVPVLASLLAHPELSEAARYALAAMPFPEATAVLRDALSADLPAASLAGIVTTLGERVDTASVVPFAGLAVHSDREVARAAIRALARIATPEALAALRNLQAPETLAREKSAALLTTARLLQNKGHDDLAAAVYSELSAPGQAESIRIAAFRGLASIRHGALTPQLLGLLQAPSPDLRAASARLIATMPDPAVTSAAAGKLPSLEPLAQIALLEALGERGDDSALPVVLTLADSQNADVRLAAIRCVGDLGGVAQTAFLTAKAGLQGAEAEAAENALARLSRSGVDEALIGALTGDSPPPVTAAVARVLEKRGTRAAAPALMKTAVAAADPGVQRECWKALRGLASPADLPQLLEVLLAKSSDKTRREAERSIIAVARDMQDADTRTALLLDALGRAEPEVRPSVLKLLGTFGGSKAAEALRKALGDGDETARYEAVKALASWPDAGPADALRDYAQSTDLITHHVLALRGYVRMIDIIPDLTEDQRGERYREALGIARRDEEKELIRTAQLSLRITDLKAQSSREFKVVRNGFVKDGPVYTDRQYVFVEIPPVLATAEHIMTAMDDKYSRGDSFITFTINRPATVYVCYDGRAKSPPAWLKPWTKTGDRIKTTDRGCDLVLYARRFPAGQVTIPGNNPVPGVGANYILAVTPERPE